MIKKLSIHCYLLILSTSLFFISCGSSLEREEIVRIKSPDSIVDAILVKTDAGATTSCGYMLYIAPTGNKPKIGNELLKADNLVNFTLNWKRPRFLEIRYEKGRILYFTNFWHSKEVQNFEYIVELRLVPLTESFSLK